MGKESSCASNLLPEGDFWRFQRPSGPLLGRGAILGGKHAVFGFGGELPFTGRMVSKLGDRMRRRKRGLKKSLNTSIKHKPRGKSLRPRGCGEDVLEGGAHGGTPQKVSSVRTLMGKGGSLKGRGLW